MSFLSNKHTKDSVDHDLQGSTSIAMIGFWFHISTVFALSFDTSTVSIFSKPKDDEYVWFRIFL